MTLALTRRRTFGAGPMPTKTKTEKASAAPEVRAQGHTPGPWEVRLSSGTDGRFISIIGETWPLAHVYTNEIVECEANARLIAAAPDLLAFIERWHDIIIGNMKRGELEPWARLFDKDAKALIETLTK